MKTRCYLFLLLGIFSLSAATVFAAPRITVDQYLEQVSGNGPGMIAAKKNATAYSLRQDEGLEITSPYIFGNYTKYDDKKENDTPAFLGTRKIINMYTVGLGANTPIGLQAKYSFNVTKSELQNAAIVPPNYYTTYNQLELNQSLLRNGFGSETRAQVDAVNAANRAQAYGEKFRSVAQEIDAENIYWRLAFSRRTVEIQKDALARAEKLLQWAKRRVNLQLGDRADLLQAQAGYDLRKLELQNAIEEERNASRAFNLLRNQESASVDELLIIPNTDEILKLKTTQSAGKRFDLIASEHQEVATISSAQLDKEKAKPNLDLFATVAWNGKDGERSEAMSESTKSKNSTVAFGVKFSAPLALFLMKKTWDGVELTKEAASLNLEKKRLDVNQDWSELKSRLEDARARLQLIQTIEATQRDKFENEKQRLLKGRTTTYQTLTFEQDYDQSQLLRIRTQAEVLRLHAQLKMFRGEQ